MRVANKLTPEPKSKMANKTTKPGHGSKNQLKTLQLLVPNSKRLRGYTQKIPRSATWFRSRKHSDDACSCSTRLEENKTRLLELASPRILLQPEIGSDADHTMS